MTDPSLAEAIEAIYVSLANDNDDIDRHIETLKAALRREGADRAVFDPDRLPVGNRAGRKMMESYFKKRGVRVSFGEKG